MPFDDSPGNGQTHARPGILVVVYSPEHAENPVRCLGIDANTVVADRKHPVAILGSCGDVDPGVVRFGT